MGKPHRAVRRGLEVGLATIALVACGGNGKPSQGSPGTGGSGAGGAAGGAGTAGAAGAAGTAGSAGSGGGATTYRLPNDNNGCPGNCRVVPWLAGTDTWNGDGTPGSGSIPSYTAVPCTNGLTEGDGTTDNAPAINSCIAALEDGQAAVLPAGMYYVNAPITIPGKKVLRGAGSTNCSQGTWMSSTFHGDTGGGATCTTLKYGTNGYLRMGGHSLGTPVNLSSGYDKGSQSLVASAAPSGMAAGDWILVSELADDSIPVDGTGLSSNCDWCGETNNSFRYMTQIFQVTAVSGTTVSTSRPMYYAFKSSLTPRIRKISGTTEEAGIEDIKLWGSTTSRSDPHIDIAGCMSCWVKSVETYDTPDVAKAYPIYMRYSYGVEVRDSYFHFGRGNGGDRNYGLGMFGPNSDHKVENNIFRENRHSLSQEGGGSGNVFLYNYVDDNYTDDSSYVGSARGNHGAHPYMTLWEGNAMSRFTVDDQWGTSSHGVFFRNWLWGDATGNYPAFTNSQPSWGFMAIEIMTGQHYFSLVGNVLGRSDNLHANWDNAQVHNSACGGTGDASRSSPTVFAFGCDNAFSGTRDTDVLDTAILHGNYDYRTKGVADWADANHTIPDSLYYSSKPSWFGSCVWPPYDGTSGPTVSTLPAQHRYDRSSCP